MAEGGEEDRSQVIAHFQEITGIEDENKIIEHLSSCQWNLEAAVQDALNEREGIRPIYGGVPSGPSRPPPPVPQSSTPSPQARFRVNGMRGAVVRREGWFEWTLNLAIFPLRFILSAANELFQLLVSIIFGSEPRPSPDPHGDVRKFITEFEFEYGTDHPPFLVKSYDEALSQSRRDLQFLLVYLHSPGHQDTPRFCQEVLSSQQFINFLANNSVQCLGVSVNSDEGVRVSYILRENTYPFLALIVLRQSRLIVCERIEGAMPLDELMGRLQVAISENESEFVVERAERHRRQEDQRLRQAQDQAFEESLAVDRAKEKQREENMMREKEQVKEEQNLQREAEMKKEAFSVEKALRVSRLPSEPEPCDPAAMQVVLRLPSGHRLERWFKNSDKLQSVYDFAYTDESGQLPMAFTLITNFPRKELVTDSDGGPVLEELQLGKRCALFVQDDTD